MSGEKKKSVENGDANFPSEINKCGLQSVDDSCIVSFLTISMQIIFCYLLSDLRN